jgi:hypothetical protein
MHPITRYLGGFTLFLGLAGALSRLLYYLTPYDWALGWIPLFDPDREANLPTWFEGALFLFISVLAAMIAWSYAQRSMLRRVQWAGLATVFGLLSVDELISVHEQWIEPLRGLLQVGDWLYFSWVIPAAVCVVLVVGGFFTLWLSLARDERMLWVLALVLFCFGALGMEMMGGFYAARYGMNTLTYALLTSVEELLEQAGLLVYGEALLRTVSGRVVLTRVE